MAKRMEFHTESLRNKYINGGASLFFMITGVESTQSDNRHRKDPTEPDTGAPARGLYITVLESLL